MSKQQKEFCTESSETTPDDVTDAKESTDDTAIPRSVFVLKMIIGLIEVYRAFHT